MERRPYLPVRRRILRQAHPRSRQRRLRPVLLLLAGLIGLGTLTLGTASGAPRGAASAPATFMPLTLDAVASAGSGAPAEVPPPAPRSAPPAARHAETPVGAARVHPAPAEAAPAASAPASVASSPAPTGPVVPRAVAAFLGDSYTTGWAGAGTGRDGWPAIVGRTLGWRTRVYAVAGTGFVNPGWTSQPIRTRVAAVVRLQPGIIFVAGGHNDRRYGASASARAAERVLERLRRGVPDAVIVVIPPMWQDANPPASIIGLRDRLRRQAVAMGAVFIDPLRGGWFAGSRHRFIGSDGIHPTQAGHRHIARLVLAGLRAQGIAASGAP